MPIDLDEVVSQTRILLDKASYLEERVDLCQQRMTLLRERMNIISERITKLDKRMDTQDSTTVRQLIDFIEKGSDLPVRGETS